LGEMAGVVLGGNRVSSNKIQSAGYEFGYSHLITAFSAIFRRDTKGDNS
jgi:NAD dependent epimerase/dehydratase family enzyme